VKTSIYLVLFLCLALSSHGETARPNILWVSSEDHGPHRSCYGDSYASTPNVDRLAAKGYDLQACLVMRAGADDGDFGDVSVKHGKRAHAEPGGVSGRWATCQLKVLQPMNAPLWPERSDRALELT
jgi:hypothetical protein